MYTGVCTCMWRPESQAQVTPQVLIHPGLGDGLFESPKDLPVSVSPAPWGVLPCLAFMFCFCLLIIICVCNVCDYGLTCATAYMWMSEHKTEELFLYFHYGFQRSNLNT